MEEADQLLLLSVVSHCSLYPSLFTLSVSADSPVGGGAAPSPSLSGGLPGLVSRSEVYSLCRVLLDACLSASDPEAAARLEGARGEEGPARERAESHYGLRGEKGVAKRHKLCTEVAEGIKGMGYGEFFLRVICRHFVPVCCHLLSFVVHLCSSLLFSFLLSRPQVGYHYSRLMVNCNALSSLFFVSPPKMVTAGTTHFCTPRCNRRAGCCNF